MGFALLLLTSVLTTAIVSAEVSWKDSEAALLRLPLLSAGHVQERRRKLQTTPQEEEGHPQVVDALYQGYGEHVSFEIMCEAKQASHDTIVFHFHLSVCLLLYYSMLTCGVECLRSAKLLLLVPARVSHKKT